MVVVVHKLSSTTVDFISSEGKLKTSPYMGSKRFYKHAQNLLRGVQGSGHYLNLGGIWDHLVGGLEPYYLEVIMTGGMACMVTA